MKTHHQPKKEIHLFSFCSTFLNDCGEKIFYFWFCLKSKFYSNKKVIIKTKKYICLTLVQHFKTIIEKKICFILFYFLILHSFRKNYISFIQHYKRRIWICRLCKSFLSSTSKNWLSANRYKFMSDEHLAFKPGCLK